MLIGSILLSGWSTHLPIQTRMRICTKSQQPGKTLELKPLEAYKVFFKVTGKQDGGT